MIHQEGKEKVVRKKGPLSSKVVSIIVTPRDTTNWLLGGQIIQYTGGGGGGGGKCPSLP